MRAGTWKLLIDRYEEEPAPPMLFNLADDIGETRDLTDRYSERVARMKTRLETWIAQVTGDATPQVRPDVDR